MDRSRSEKTRAGTAEVFPAGLILTTSRLDASFSAHYRFSIFSIAMGLLRFCDLVSNYKL